MLLYNVTIENSPADVREVLMSTRELVNEIQRLLGGTEDEAFTVLRLLGNTNHLPTEETDEARLSWCEHPG